MVRGMIPVACVVLAVSISGCQKRDLSNPAISMKNKSIESVRGNEESKATDTAKTQDNNNPIVIAYYFHRTMRCPTCLAIEANAARVIEADFSEQIAGGRLIWIPFNLDEPGGEEFEKEFDLSVSTLVLEKTEDSDHAKYKKLEKVWDFVGDPVKFDTYIQEKVKQFLNE